MISGTMDSSHVGGAQSWAANAAPVFQWEAAQLALIAPTLPTRCA